MRLTVVGVGPGDPDLITLKGVRAVQAATIIFVPKSRDSDDSVALRIAAQWIDTTRQDVIHLPLAMTTHSDDTKFAAAAATIADTFATHAHQRNDDQNDEPEEVRGVYLVLGDPQLYGTFATIGRELAIHAPHIVVNIIPGITSFAATAAQTHVVLGAGNERVAIVPARPDTDAALLHQLLAHCETLVLMKVGRVLPQVLDALDELGVLDTTLFAERIGMPEEDIVPDVRALRGQQRSYLSLLIVRKGSA